MSSDENNIAISYCIEEFEIDDENDKNTYNEFNIENFLSENENENENINDILLPHMINYYENFTVKELLLICKYYGFSKMLKNNKCDKGQIIQELVFFENDPNNSDIVCKRQNMWFYINELKNDHFMKKYIIW